MSTRHPTRWTKLLESTRLSTNGTSPLTVGCLFLRCCTRYIADKLRYPFFTRVGIRFSGAHSGTSIAAAATPMMDAGPPSMVSKATKPTTLRSWSGSPGLIFTLLIKYSPEPTTFPAPPPGDIVHGDLGCAPYAAGGVEGGGRGQPDSV